ncbi:MAG: hypothetical protein ACE5D7_10620, partial [Fidelibacterota bacterium]
SVALTKIDMDFKFVGVFIPDLSKLNFKLQRTNSPDFIRNGIRNILLSLIYSENELIASRLEKFSYDLGEMVNIVGTYNDDYVDKPDRMVFTLLDDSGEVVQEIPAEFDVDSREYKGNFLVDKSGSLKIISKSFWNNGNEYNSAPVEFVVQNVIVEDRDLQTNRKALLELSSNNNGQFFMLDDLLKMYNTMEFASERKVKSYQLSTISTHKWWWLIIILLSAEWFIRKRIGLL